MGLPLEQSPEIASYIDISRLQNMHYMNSRTTVLFHIAYCLDENLPINPLTQWNSQAILFQRTYQIVASQDNAEILMICSWEMWLTR